MLTHDVETRVGLDALDPVLDLERATGFRSSWNFVPRRRYAVSEERIRTLIEGRFEVGAHGLYHDGRDLESRSKLVRRLPAMRAAAARWNAVGFRAPATQRDWALMPTLGFDYDSSYPDTDPFEPSGGGSCTWLPFFVGDMIELPMTMPQDHTLFVILRQPDAQAWIDKAESLRSRGDALPADVSGWWRRSARSRLRRTGAGWAVAGPAAGEARVEFAPPERSWFDAIGGLAA